MLQVWIVIFQLVQNCSKHFRIHYHADTLHTKIEFPKTINIFIGVKLFQNFNYYTEQVKGENNGYRFL